MTKIPADKPSRKYYDQVDKDLLREVAFDKMTTAKAAFLIGCTQQQVSRWAKRYRDEFSETGYADVGLWIEVRKRDITRQLRRARPHLTEEQVVQETLHTLYEENLARQALFRRVQDGIATGDEIKAFERIIAEGDRSAAHVKAASFKQ